MVLFGGACSAPPAVSPPPVDGAGPAPPGRELPGEPMVRELDTQRAYIVRMSEAGNVSSVGWIHIFAPVPGVMIGIDGGQQLPLPQTVNLEEGSHQLEATCPDGSTETYHVTIEQGATVHLQVCAGPSRRP